jgi:chemotaxis protein MotB
MRREALPPAIAASSPDRLWVLTLTDLVCLLLSFFVMIYAMQRPAGPWAPPPTALSFAEQPAADGRPSLPSAAYNSGRAAAVPGLQLDYLAPLLARQLAEDRRLAGVALRHGGDSLALRLDAALFATEGGLTPEGRAAVGSLAALLMRLSNGVEVVGRGAGWAEGLARAEAMGGALKAAGYARPLVLLSQPGGEAAVELVLREDRGATP